MSALPPLPVLAAYVVAEKQDGQRLDLFLKERIPKLSRARIQEAIRLRVSLPGRGRPKPASIVRRGDTVEVHAVESSDPPFPPELEPRLLLVDEDLVAADKPAGLPVHATRAVTRNHLVRWLRERYGESLALAHRIDRETSGVVLSVRTQAAARLLAADFAAGRVHKEYLALVLGLAPIEMVIDAPVGPDPRSAVHIKQTASAASGLPSRTRFRRERLITGDGSAPMSLVRAFPETGRRHQIRVHLQAAGFPVVGDKLYARGERHFLNYITRGVTPAMIEALGAARHMLHAAVLELRHPRDGRRLRIAAPLPEDFLRLLDEPRR